VNVWWPAWVGLTYSAQHACGPMMSST